MYRGNCAVISALCDCFCFHGRTSNGPPPNQRDVFHCYVQEFTCLPVHVFILSYGQEFICLDVQQYSCSEMPLCRMPCLHAFICAVQCLQEFTCWYVQKFSLSCRCSGCIMFSCAEVLTARAYTACTLCSYAYVFSRMCVHIFHCTRVHVFIYAGVTMLVGLDWVPCRTNNRWSCQWETLSRCRMQKCTSDSKAIAGFWGSCPSAASIVGSNFLLAQLNVHRLWTITTVLYNRISHLDQSFYSNYIKTI